MKTKITKSFKGGFTMVELLVVVAILAILTVGVIFFLSPAQLASQGRDSNRLSDMTDLNQNLSLYHETNPSGSLGTAGITYVSIPDPTATTTAGTNCAGIGLTSTSTVYHCASPSTYRNINGTGWVPVNFAAMSSNSMATLPIDPVNTTSSNEYYVYATNGTNQFEIASNPEAAKTMASNNSSSYVQGNNLALETVFPVVGTQATSTATSTTNGPQSIWVGDGELYPTIGQVSRFTSTGAYISKFPATAPGDNGEALPAGIAIDSSGNLWVSNQQIGNVEEFSSSGTYLSEFGSAGTGNGQFFGPAGIAIDSSGNFWVVDEDNYRVEEFSSNGTYLSQFGSQGSGNGQFLEPIDIAIDSSGHIFVNDEGGDNRVEEFSSTGAYISKFGSTGSGNGQFNGPAGIAIDSSGNIWVADTDNNRVEKFSSTGTYLSQFGSAGSTNGKFKYPFGIAIDSSGNFWVVDGDNYRVEEFSSSGTYLSQFGSQGTGNGQFQEPYSIAIH